MSETEWFIVIVEGELSFSCYDFSVFFSVREMADICVVVDEYVGLLFMGWDFVVGCDCCV